MSTGRDQLGTFRFHAVSILQTGPSAPERTYSHAARNFGLLRRCVPTWTTCVLAFTRSCTAIASSRRAQSGFST